MEILPFEIVLLIAAYLTGTLPSALWVCRFLTGQDPRELGSHNPGATNVLRIAGRKAAFITFLFDFGKGWAALAFVKLFHPDHKIMVAAAIAVTLGHIIPFYAVKRGGKGVATAMGVCFGFYWPLALLVITLWGAIFALSRTSSVASLFSMALGFVICLWIWQRYEEITAALAFLLVISHRENIRRLLNQQEHRF